MRLVVADTSCLIIFHKINSIDILKDTFKKVLITDKVLDEFGDLPKWLEVRNDYDLEAYHKFSKNFGPSESSCIALAQKIENPILLLDDRRAKKVAQEIGIECVGTLGVLLLAKREGVIEKIKPLIEQIKQTDFRVSDKIIETVVRLAGEE